MIHRPEVYKEYEQRKEEAKLHKEENVVWKVPEDVMELKQILGMVSQANAAFEIELQEEAKAELKNLQGIDLELLGDDDG